MSDRVIKDNDGDEDRPFNRLQGSLVDSQLTAEDDDESFEVIDTDSDLKPLSQERDDGTEARLSEEEEGEKPLLEQRREAQDPEEGKRRRDRAEERRRRREGRQRTFAENAELKAEIAALREQVEGIRPRLSQIDQQRIQDQVSRTEREIQEAAQSAVAARRKLAEAVATADTDAITNALEERDAAIQRGQELTAQKTRLAAAIPAEDQRRTQEQGSAQPRQQQQRSAPPLPPVAAEFVKDFRETHNWMRTLPDGRPADLDTAIMLYIDNEVASEGFDPSTQDYWDEVEERARQRIPKRFETQPRTRQQPATQQVRQQEVRRGPMTSGASDRAARPSSDNKVYISPERKQALIDIGALDRNGKTVLDTVQYKNIMRSYQKYDRDNGTTG